MRWLCVLAQMSCSHRCADISFPARILAELFYIPLDIRLYLKSVLHSWFSGDNRDAENVTMLLLAFNPAQYYTLCLLPSIAPVSLPYWNWVLCNLFGIDSRYDLRAMPVREFFLTRSFATSVGRGLKRPVLSAANRIGEEPSFAEIAGN